MNLSTNIERFKMYTSLNDAAIKYDLKELAPGATKIWYIKTKFFRDFVFNTTAALIQRAILGKAVTLEVLYETHTLLGEIIETDLEKIFDIMQGENWSPEGEAKGLIVKLNLSHASMSVGDIIEIGNEIWMVDNFSFKKL